MKTMRRIFAVILACVAMCVGVWVALLFRFGWAVGTLIAVVTASLVVGAYVVAIGPWQRRWGATDDEVSAPMPGDEILRPGAAGTTRAITIDAPPEQVWPWLVQIGYGRGGWYSYDWLDNDGRPSVDRIDPGLQGLAVGDQIVMVPGMGWRQDWRPGPGTAAWAAIADPGAFVMERKMLKTLRALAASPASAARDA